MSVRARKMDFTSIGDVTNVASKIQELTTELECELVVSEALAGLVKDHFDLAAAGPVSLKGRPFAINIFIVMGEKEPAVDNARRSAAARERRVVNAGAVAFILVAVRPSTREAIAQRATVVVR